MTREENKDYLNIARIKRNRKIGNFTGNIVKLILIVGLSFVILFPLIVAAIPTFTSVVYLGSQKSIWIPEQYSVISYQLSSYLISYSTSILPTLLFALSMALVQVLISAFVGYGFAQMKFRGANLLFGLVILTIIIPPQSIMLKQLQLFGKLGIPTKIVSLYLMAFLGQGLKSGLFIFLFRQFFKGLPKELEEAAFVDGCGFIKTFFKIVLPSAGSVALTVVVFAFIWNYTDTYYLSAFAQNNASSLLPVSIRNELILNTGNIKHDAIHVYGIPETSVTNLFIGTIGAAGFIMYIIPAIILYFIVQRKFVQGFERSGLTGM